MQKIKERTCATAQVLFVFPFFITESRPSAYEIRLSGRFRRFCANPAALRLASFVQTKNGNYKYFRERFPGKLARIPEKGAILQKSKERTCAAAQVLFIFRFWSAQILWRPGLAPAVRRIELVICAVGMFCKLPQPLFLLGKKAQKKKLSKRKCQRGDAQEGAFEKAPS